MTATQAVGEGRRIDRDEIEAKLREIRGEVNAVAAGGRDYAIVAGAVAAVAVMGVAYVLGRRRGRRAPPWSRSAGCDQAPVAPRPAQGPVRWLEAMDDRVGRPVRRRSVLRRLTAREPEVVYSEELAPAGRCSSQRGSRAEPRIIT